MLPAVDAPPGVTRHLVGLAVLLAAVSGAVYAFGAIHEPNYLQGLLGSDFAEAVRLKAWLTTVVLGLAMSQLVLALWIYDRLPLLGAAPRWAHLAHRGGGYALLLTSLPIAVHCLLAYGTQTMTPRTAVHSIAGCAFYGAFAAKVVCVRSRRFPGWVLPVLGSSLVTLVALLWYSAALWYFNDFTVPLLP